MGNLGLRNVININNLYIETLHRAAISELITADTNVFIKSTQSSLYENCLAFNAAV